MHLYHVIRNDGGGGYDTYSDFVVASESIEKARCIHPEGGCEWVWNKENSIWVRGTETEISDINMLYGDWGVWVSPDKVTVEYLGEAAGWLEEGDVICSSFHAG